MPFNGSTFFNGLYNVSFSGTLQNDARPLTARTPDFIAQTDVQAQVNVTTSYTGTVFGAQAFNTSNPLAYFEDYSNLQTQVNSINTSASGASITNAITGQPYYYDFTTLNPTAISSSNSVELLGKYHSAEKNNRIEFGTLSGTATLVQGDIIIPGPNGRDRYMSAFGLAYDLIPTITTTLDETGLVTPTVAVTNGINMNGSKVTNLAAGTAPGDAVTVSQLTAVTSTLGNAVTALQGDVGSMNQRLDDLFASRNADRTEMRSGVASAVAMANAPMPSEPGRTSYVVNGATFRGQQAIGVSLMHRFNTPNPLAVGAGVSYAGGSNTAGRVSVAGEF